MNFKKTLSVALMLLTISLMFATHFTRIWTGNNPFQAYNLRMYSAKIGTTTLENLVEGDEVAVFDGENCVGLLVVPSAWGTYQTIKCQKDADQVAPWTGYETLNTPIVKIWSTVYNREITLSNAHITITQGTLSFSQQTCGVNIAYLDATLPVELSAFNTAVLANNTVSLSWVTQSENNLFGYHLYRGTENQIASADRITSSMIAPTNTSNETTYSFTDAEVAPATTYYYWLQSVESNGSSEYFGPYTVRTNETSTTPVLPTQTLMNNAYPNPFNGTTHTNFEVDVKEGEVAQLSIYNIKGQIVKTYNSINPGNHKFMWNGKDANNNNCAAGIYFYKLSSPTYSSTKKMMYIK